MFAGVLLIAITASLLAVFVVTGTADHLRNEFRARGLRNHVVVCGLGTVGTAVARDLFASEPQVAAGPVALAATDMVTLVIYFSLARQLLG